MHKVPRYGPGAAAQAAMAQHELNAHIELPPHPFVVAMHHCWQDDRSVYLLLELCACSLYDAFFAPGDEYGGGEGAWLPGDTVKVYVGSVALALRHLHRHGFVFRDLKLENVLLTAEVQRDTSKYESTTLVVGYIVTSCPPHGAVDRSSLPSTAFQ